jgi:hypothetical protein
LRQPRTSWCSTKTGLPDHRAGSQYK